MCKTSPVVRQFITVICCTSLKWYCFCGNLLTISFGLSNGWPTINFAELQSANSTFPMGPVALDELALIMSIHNIGCFLGNFAVAPISKLIGVKKSIHSLGSLYLLVPLLIIWAQNVYYLYLSRLLAGFVIGCLAVAIPILINDISFDDVRGTLCSLYCPLYNMGVIIAYVLGNYLNCFDQVLTHLILPTVFIAVLFFLPESPAFLFKRDKEMQLHAIKSLKFYKGSQRNFENELFIDHTLPLNGVAKNGFIDADIDDGSGRKNRKSIRERLICAIKPFRSRQAKRAFFISFTTVILSLLCSTYTIAGYVTDIFIQTGSSFSEKTSSILIAAITLITNLLFLCIVERINRKTLYIVGAILTALSLFSFAIYCLWWLERGEHKWIPPLCLASIIFFSQLGLMPIPNILSVELFPKEIREISLAIITSSGFIFMFFSGYLFPFCLKTFGLSTCMFMFGIACILNAIFGMFFVPETRGKSHEEIMLLLTH